MPCYHCGARQVDPVRGHSPWKRGVRADQQVLICPDCQATRDWAADLDRCRRCGSAHLVRRLGEVECRDCGAVSAPATESDADTRAAETPTARGGCRSEGSAPGLAEEVDRALSRVLGRSAVPR